MIRKARLPHRRCPFFVETFAFLSNMAAYYGIFGAQGRGVKGEVGFASDCIYSPNSYPLERTSEQMNSVEAQRREPRLSCASPMALGKPQTENSVLVLR